MDPTPLVKNTVNAPKASKKLYFAAVGLLVVVAVLGSSQYMVSTHVEEVMARAMDQPEDLPHYIRGMWENWKIKYGKDKFYSLGVEDDYRMRVFYMNVLEIQDFYRGPKQTYKVALNQFADLTDAEFQAIYTDPNMESLAAETQDDAETTVFDTTDLPASWDWRDHGKVNAIKNQLHCGSCWAFSATTALESAMAIQTGTLPIYAEQQLVDCIYSRDGCKGGWMSTAWNYQKKSGNGARHESDYPYTHVYAGSCQQSGKKEYERVRSFTLIPQFNDTQMVAAAAKHVVAICIEANFRFYHSGIYKDEQCGHNCNHGVAVVGYGTDAGQPFYQIRNSWGGHWGESGYIRFARNVSWKYGQCGMLNHPMFVEVDA